MYVYLEHWSVSENVIRKVLLRRGYTRHKVAEKPRPTVITIIRRNKQSEAHSNLISVD